jgi:hypothetical protein
MRIKLQFPSISKLHPLRAQGLVEFALVLPILLLLVFGVIEFGRLLFVYSTVFTASREATRYGAAAGVVSGIPRYNDCAGIRDQAKALGRLVGIGDGDITIRYDSGPETPVLPPSNCPIPDGIEVIGGVHRIIVTVNADFTPIAPLVPMSAITISSKNARTILGNMSVKASVPVIPTPLPGQIHVGDLAASRSLVSEDKWRAQVTVTVHDAFHNAVSGVTVVGIWTDIWTDGTDTTAQCVTNHSGQCTLTSGEIPTDVAQISFTVSNLTHSTHSYSAEHNHDSGGESPGFTSDGNAITIPKP